MTRVLLVRHGAAMDPGEADARGVSEFDRPLTDAGVAQIRTVAGELAERAPRPARILSSPLRRAQQTAAILATRFPGAKVETVAELAAGAHPAQLERVVGVDEDECVALVGHEPDLGLFAGWLVHGTDEQPYALRKGGAVLVEFAAAPRRGMGSLVWRLPE